MDLHNTDPDDAPDILALDKALSRLEATDECTAEVVRLRYFAGLTIDQTAELLGVSTATVSRTWTYARAWLYEAMDSS